MTESGGLAVELKNLSKRFGEVRANSDISLKVRSSSIHAIVGENGAGKSTAMGMLYGLHRPDHGEIWVAGKRKYFRTPSQAIEAGIGMVQQHFSLSGPETVLDNILLGREPLLKGLRLWPRSLSAIDRATAERRLNEISEAYQLKVDWHASLESLPVGLQQRVEILKLLYRKAEILILDEPTAVLTPIEIEAFFSNLRTLREQGKSILIVTHKLREVLYLADEVTVFRAGCVVGHRQIRDTNEDELAELMVGRKIKLHSQPLQVEVSDNAKPLLRVENLSLKNLNRPTQNILQQLSFDIKAGEILGVAGVQGNGQSELEEILLSPRSFFTSGQASGHIFLNENEVSHHSTVQLFREGLACITEDRHKNGLLKTANLADNFLLGLHHFQQFSSRGVIHWDTLKGSLAQAISEFEIKTPDFTTLAGGLSGGNQQKLIIARELCKNPKVLIAAQPTRGVDVGAIEFIHHRLRQLQKSGAAILLISSELTEILSLSTRILVFYQGKIAATFASNEANEHKLGRAMGGVL